MDSKRVIFLKEVLLVSILLITLFSASGYVPCGVLTDDVFCGGAFDALHPKEKSFAIQDGASKATFTLSEEGVYVSFYRVYVYTQRFGQFFRCLR